MFSIIHLGQKVIDFDWRQHSDYIEKINDLKKHMNPIRKDCPEFFKKLLPKMLAQKASNRPTIDKLLAETEKYLGKAEQF